MRATLPSMCPAKTALPRGCARSTLVPALTPTCSETRLLSTSNMKMLGAVPPMHTWPGCTAAAAYSSPMRSVAKRDLGEPVRLCTRSSSVPTVITKFSPGTTARTSPRTAAKEQ